MKFSEKLIKLRKDNKLSQEQLANMLDVSRQSVSKWESGQTYPEMDKLLSLCKIFKCTLDELTNDEISQEEMLTNSKKKNTFRSAIYDMLEFINKSISMLKAMSFKEILKMLFELFILVIFLFILYFPFNLVISIGENALNFIFGYHYNISYLWNGAINIIYWLLFIIVFVYIYKVRFVDKCVEVDADEVKVINDTKKEIVNDKVVIRNDKEDKSFPLFNTLSSLVKWMMKLLVIFMGIPLIFTLIFLVFAFIMNLVLMFKGVIFIGVLFGVIALIAFNIMLLEMAFKFIFNMSINFKKMFILFLSSIVGFGVSLGLFAYEISSIKYVNDIPKDVEMTTKNYEFTMKDGLFVDTEYSAIVKLINRQDNDCYYDGDYYLCTDFKMEVVQDDSLKDKIKIELKYVKDFNDMYINEYDNSIFIGRTSLFDFNSFVKINNIIVDNLKNKKVYNYDKITDATVKISLSSKTKEQLEANALKRIKLKEEEYNNDKMEKLLEENSSLREENDSLQEKVDYLNSKKEELEEIIEDYKNRISDLLE